MTAAMIGYNTRYAIEDAVGSGVYVELAEVFEAVPPTFTVDQVEATHYQSPNRTKEYIAGFSDPGTASAQMNYVPNSTTDQRIRALRAAGTVLSHRITYPNGVTVTYPASVESYEDAIPNGDRLTATAGFKVSGAVVVAAGSAPANTVLPAISGTVQQGETLTAWPGVWTNGPTFTYQWLNEGAPISGATSATYVPVLGDVGDALSVTVTGTNAIGSASATSSATIDVLAE